MTDFPSYAYGTVTISAGGAVITGADTNWSGVNARAGDDFKVAGHVVDIVDVIDETHLKIDAWPYDAVTDAEYKIVQRSPLRFVGGVARADLTQLLATLKAKGLLWYLPDGLIDPNDAKPALTADEDQGILDIATKQLWVMQGGAWVAAGSFSGFGNPQDYNAGATYHPLDIVIKDGAVYLVKATITGNAPPNATYYSVIAPAGAAATVAVGTVTTGAPGSNADVTNSGTSNAAVLDFTIPTGKSYGGTSTTSMTIGLGSKTFDIQSGLAYVAGDRVHIGASADGLNWMEGFVSDYSGASMTVAVSDVGGTGTFTAWGIGLTGKPGAGDGDMKEAVYDPNAVGADAFDSANTRFLQAGTGAVARSVQDKMRDVVNVKDFGAKCDGATDDIAAFNMACASGRVVLVPAGSTSVVSEAINIPSNCVLKSDGFVAATIKTTSATADIISIALGSGNFENVSVDNLLFASSVPKTAGSVIHVSSTGGALYTSRFSNLRWGPNIFHGLTIEGALYLELSNIRSIDGLGPNAHFISLDGSASGTLVAAVSMFNVGCIVGEAIPGSTLSIGLYLSDRSAGVYVNNLQLEGAGIDYDIWIANPSGDASIAPRDMKINNLICDTASTGGINIVYAQNLSFHNSWVASTTAYGVEIGGGNGILFCGCNVLTSNGPGITIRSNATHTQIMGCQFDGNTNYGIFVAAGTTNFQILGNSFCRGTPHHQYDVYIDTGTSNNYIVSNNNFNGWTNGPLFDGGTGTSKRIDGNISLATGNTSYASAATVTLPQFQDTFIITGSDSITEIASPTYLGRRITLMFAGAATLVHGGGIHLKGGANWTATAFLSAITLVSDGGVNSWFEAAR